MMPSGNGADTMPNLERVMQLAYDHGYRVGLQIGKCGRVVIHVRDMTREQKVIALIGDELEECASRLFVEMLKRNYVPRQATNMMGA